MLFIVKIYTNNFFNTAKLVVHKNIKLRLKN